MNKSIELICFHGSPGTPDDFDSLAKKLENIKILAIPRYKENKANSNDLSSYVNKIVFVLGYSWGGIPAIDYAIKNHLSTKGIILVSPYLFPSKSKVIKRVVDIPILGEYLLGVMGNKFIDNLLKKSSYPDNPPLDYKRVSSAYTSILKASIDEKTRGEDVIEMLRKIKKLSIPLFLIWGEKDLTSRESTQILPIKINARPILEERIKNAGHALIFTKPKEVAQIILKVISPV